MLRALGCACVVFFRFISATGKIFAAHQRKTPHRFAVRRKVLLLDDVVFRAIRELGDVFPALFVDDQDVVLTIAAGTW